MAESIITHITDNGTEIEAGPDANEYLRRLRGAIMTKRPEQDFSNQVSRKLKISSEREIRRLKWGI
jgi:hypothetical protein